MKIREPKWLSKRAIRAMHEALIAKTGGTSGILNEGMIESTLSKPKNIYYYDNNCSIFKLAASYGYGFAKNHCFIDGNKRIALAATSVFLRINGYQLEASEESAVQFFLSLAASLETQDEAISHFIDWLQDNTNKI